MGNSALVRTALPDLFRWGLYPIPLDRNVGEDKNRGKLPPKGFSWKEFQSRCPTSEEWEKWLRTWNNLNVAAVLGEASGMFVIDTDTPPALEEVLGYFDDRWPQTPTVQTSRGYHFYFKHPGTRIKSRPVPLLEGVDCKADGGICVLPPSIHPSGTRYTWKHTPDEFPFALPPKSLLALLEDIPKLPAPLSPSYIANQYRSDGRHFLEEALARAVPGTRNATLFWAACQWRDDCVDQARAEALAREYAQRVTGGDFTEREAISTVCSAYHMPAREPARSPSSRRPNKLAKPAKVVSIGSHHKAELESDVLYRIRFFPRGYPQPLGNLLRQMHLKDSGFANSPKLEAADAVLAVWYEALTADLLPKDLAVTAKEFQDITFQLGRNMHIAFLKKGLDLLTELGLWELYEFQSYIEVQEDRIETRKIRRGRPPAVYRPRILKEAMAEFAKFVTVRAFEAVTVGVPTLFSPAHELGLSDEELVLLNEARADRFQAEEKAREKAKERLQEIRKRYPWLLDPTCLFHAPVLSLPPGPIENGAAFASLLHRMKFETEREGKPVRGYEVGRSNGALREIRKKNNTVIVPRYKMVPLQSVFKDPFDQVEEACPGGTKRRWGVYFVSSSGEERRVNPLKRGDILDWLTRQYVIKCDLFIEIQERGVEKRICDLTDSDRFAISTHQKRARIASILSQGSKKKSRLAPVTQVYKSFAKRHLVEQLLADLPPETYESRGDAALDKHTGELLGPTELARAIIRDHRNSSMPEIQGQTLSVLTSGSNEDVPEGMIIDGNSEIATDEGTGETEQSEMAAD